MKNKERSGQNENQSNWKKKLEAINTIMKSLLLFEKLINKIASYM